MARIIVLSDLHLSPTHGFFWENWRLARDFAHLAGAELAIVNGDLCINGPDSDAEMAFAAAAMAGLNGLTLTLPGNHDVGDEPPGQDLHQIVDAARLARWRASFGPDRFAVEAGGWSLIGLNAQLYGSGLAQEQQQDRWLDEQLAAASGQPVALFLHKPLFMEHPHESEATPASLQPAPRRALIETLRAAGVRMVVSGHLHQFRDRVVDGIRHVWLPAVAFAPTRPAGGDPRCGLVVIELSEAGADIRLEYPAGMISHDLAAIKGHGRYRFLRDMPACPPPADAPTAR